MALSIQVTSVAAIAIATVAQALRCKKFRSAANTVMPKTKDSSIRSQVTCSGRIPLHRRLISVVRLERFVGGGAVEAGDGEFQEAEVDA